MKKILLCFIIIGLMGCSKTTALREEQNNQIIMLQDMKKQILLRPAHGEHELNLKNKELEMIDNQLKMAMRVQQNSQDVQNQKNKNMMGGVLTGLGVASIVHYITK